MGEPQHTSLGFDDPLDGASAKDWTPNKPANGSKPDPDAVRREAEKVGFTSREATPKPINEPEGQITIRGKQSTVDGFRTLASRQEPKWPLGYTLERALAALERELAS